MTYFDCFNGDADGLCALTQLRLNHKVKSELVTGVKRDIGLLAKIVDRVEPGDVVTVLDVSMHNNKQDLLTILGRGAHVFYCDHHFVEDIPNHPNLVSLVNIAPDVCTSLLINQHLNSAYLAWAIVGTYGDNLSKSALGLAKKLELAPTHLKTLQNLGVYLNYNGYGASVDDLFFAPSELFKRTSAYKSPFDFIRDDAATYQTLEAGYHSDMQKASESPAEYSSESAAVFILPDERWARRVSGVYSNELANRMPDRAHAVVTEQDSAHYLISVRAPLNNKVGADEVCRQFATGGGRAAAAGINALPKSDLPRFIKALSAYYA